jgi:hypothetical protein
MFFGTLGALLTLYGAVDQFPSKLTLAYVLSKTQIPC